MLTYSTQQEYNNHITPIRSAVKTTEHLIESIILDPFKTEFELTIRDYNDATNHDLKIDLSRYEQIYKLLSVLVYDYDIRNALPQVSAGFADTLRQYTIRLLADGIAASGYLSSPERALTVEQLTDDIVYYTRQGNDIFDICDAGVRECEKILKNNSTAIRNSNSKLYSFEVLDTQWQKRQQKI